MVRAVSICANRRLVHLSVGFVLATIAHSAFSQSTGGDCTRPSVIASLLSALAAAIFTGIVSFFVAVGKIKIEVRETIKTTFDIETEKAKVAATAARDSDKWNTIYACVLASQSLVHSMCWLSWDAKTRGEVRKDMTKLYDKEAHKFLPEIFGQLAVLRYLAPELHALAYDYATRLVKIDVEFGEAILLAEKNSIPESVAMFRQLHEKAFELQLGIDKLFGGKLDLKYSDGAPLAASAPV